MEPIRVLIADDHAFYREGVRTMLSSVPETEVIGEAGTGDEVITLALTLQPDVILMDLKMPGPNGIEATRRILHSSPRMGVLVITMFEDDDSVFAAMGPVATCSKTPIRTNWCGQLRRSAGAKPSSAPPLRSV